MGNTLAANSSLADLFAVTIAATAFSGLGVPSLTPLVFAAAIPNRIGIQAEPGFDYESVMRLHKKGYQASSVTNKDHVPSQDAPWNECHAMLLARPNRCANLSRVEVASK